MALVGRFSHVSGSRALNEVSTELRGSNANKGFHFLLAAFVEAFHDGDVVYDLRSFSPP